MNVLVWNWGRRGAGSLFAVRLASALAAADGDHSVSLSLAAGAEILMLPDALHCDWLEPTYDAMPEYAIQRPLWPFRRRRILKQIQNLPLRPDIAICARPSLLDGDMVSALHKLDIDYAVVVHELTAHQDEIFHTNFLGQNRLLRNAPMLFALSSQIETDLYHQGYGTGSQVIFKLWPPPFHFREMTPPLAHGGRPERVGSAIAEGLEKMFMPRLEIHRTREAEWASFAEEILLICRCSDR
jgi:hypothetical protein